MLKLNLNKNKIVEGPFHFFHPANFWEDYKYIGLGVILDKPEQVVAGGSSCFRRRLILTIYRGLIKYY